MVFRRANEGKLRPLGKNYLKKIISDITKGHGIFINIVE